MASPAITVRSGALEDIRAFNGLVNNSGGAVFFRATFGQFNFSSMVETSCINLIAITDTEVDNTCVGYMSVTDSPAIGKEGTAFDKTIAVIQEHLPEVSNRNSLFVNFLLLDERPDFNIDAIGTDLLTAAFREYPDMDYMLWLCPSAVKLTDWTAKNFMEPVSDALKESCESKSNIDEPLLGHRLLYAHRDSFLPKLRVRGARVEDNDELLPILQASSPGTFENQGSYFLADLIQQQDDNNRFFVGVHNDSPVGMVATSKDVNVGMITKVFDVSAYPDMFVAKEKSPPPPPLVVGIMGDVRSLDYKALASLVKENRCVLIDAEALASPAVEESKDEDVTTIEIEQANAERFHKAIREKIEEASAASPENPPPFCVLKGYPRNDAEAEVISKDKPMFDMVLELCTEPADAVDEPDENLLSHLDALEALQNFLDIGNAPAWKKYQMGEVDSEEVFCDSFRDLVLTRINEIDENAALEEAELPGANAFAITVMACKDGFETRIGDLLRAVFEDHPSLGYCMYMAPNKSETPNKLVGNMVRCKLRNGISFDQTLYIMHRDAVLAYDLLSVERSLESGRHNLQSFLNPVGDNAQVILDSCEDAYKFNDVDVKDNPMSICFEVRLDASIIGVITLSRKNIGNDDINWMRSNFMIDDFVSFDRHRARSQAFVTNFLISPVYGRWTRYVIREVMRKFLKTVLYFQHEKDVTPPLELVDNFLPVPPRRRQQPWQGAELPLSQRPSSGMQADCPLYQLTKNDLTRPKTTVLNRIVIFGGGTSAWGVLEKLCFAHNFNFPNIYLISDAPVMSFCKKGQSTEDFSLSCDGMLSAQDISCPPMSELYAFGFGHRVNYIRGRLTDIDRENRAIIVSDELVVEYDQLIIAGTTKDKSFKSFPSTSGMHSSYCEKRGIFGLGDPYTDTKAFDWVSKQDREKWPIVIYGAGMDISAALGALLNKGIPSRRINLVIRNEELPENCHPSMNDNVIRSMRSAGVILHRNYKVIDVKLSSYGSIEGLIIQNLAEGADDEPIEIPCFSLLCCNQKYCDPDVFAAVNDCGIVYDGGIVVDQDFRTVDENVYAVGEFTRFSRMYSKEPLHKLYCSYEMGRFCAKRILNNHLHCPQEALDLAPNKMPRFNLPHTCLHPMPGGKWYFNSKVAAEAEDGNVLITGDIKTNNMCALKLDSFCRVVEICFIGKTEVEARNLSKLIGVHESFLNSALNAYEEGKVEDWIEWFRQEWFTALYHDGLGQMNENIRAALGTDKGTYTTLDRVQDAVDASTENEKLHEEWSALIGPRGCKLEGNTKRIVETSTVDYLRSNKVMLNRFALPQAKSKKEK